MEVFLIVFGYENGYRAIVSQYSNPHEIEMRVPTLFKKNLVLIMT